MCFDYAQQPNFDYAQQPNFDYAQQPNFDYAQQPNFSAFRQDLLLRFVERSRNEVFKPVEFDQFKNICISSLLNIDETDASASLSNLALELNRDY